MSDTANVDLGEWEGALGPQSEGEPVFYEMTLGEDEVRLVGPSPGMLYEYPRGEFEALVEEGEWLPATNDIENEVFRTPEGDQPW
ncbi:hypothetical protein [Salinirubrum litoreum]|uniref:Uncharacterized protein n=1 Tax=Salinirubrum litoreum TaxID=1126234 RepID=A0ABD5R6D5_9EURY|nr:hypothetical protein [Salinirubrum litoreum]